MLRPTQARDPPGRGGGAGDPGTGPEPRPRHPPLVIEESRRTGTARQRLTWT